MDVAQKEQKKNVEKIIIDTDPGMDDAMAIMLALNEHKKGNLKVLAITLVNGNSTTDNAQINILRVLEIFHLEYEVKSKFNYIELFQYNFRVVVLLYSY